MLNIKNCLNHLKTITKHKIVVGKLLCKCGLYKQALTHDLSKYSLIELKTGFNYYQGFRSPIEQERETKGYSLGWLHHKGRNKHHWEYWMDNSPEGLTPLEMPLRYVIEMFCDRVAASMVYLGDKYNNNSPLDYYENSKSFIILNHKTRELLEFLLNSLANNGLNETIKYIKSNILN